MRQKMRDSLARFFGKDKISFKLVQPCEFAHCVIDVQRQFCDPSFSQFGTRKTDSIASHIAKIAPQFRTAGMPTYMIYHQKWCEPSESAFGGFHRVQPEEGDIVFGKAQHSAFEYTDLADRFRAAGIKTLLVSGFDIDCCVNATVQDALREDFNVLVLSDCIGNGGKYVSKKTFIDLMKDNGAELITSGEAKNRLAAFALT